jgi:hypothetical protein
MGINNLAESNQLKFYTSNNQFSNFQKTTSFTQNQYIILDEIGEKASQMMYIHMNISLNLTVLYDQADLFTSYL